MQGTPYSEIEFTFLESLINEENKRGDQNTIQVEAIASIRDYVQADEALFILFDFENPDLASKKLLGPDHTWKSESVILKQDSSLCGEITETIILIDPKTVTDLIIFDSFDEPFGKLALMPLGVGKVVLGGIFFTNPRFDFQDERRSKFLQLMLKGLANAIYAVEHNRQLIISKADLEASQWEILNSRNMLRTFFDNIPSCIYVIDQSYTILIINNRRSERVNKKPQELVGGKCYEKLYGNAAPCPNCRVADAFAGIPSVRSMREWLPKETFIQWEITTVPIRESSNVIHRAIVFDEDVTEKWILEASLVETEKLASIGQLAANVAHEINNPLAAIIANAQLLLREYANGDEDTREALQLIEMAGVRAAKIVGNLLKSARKEKREEFEEISLNETILDALSMVNFEIRNRNITLKLELSEDMPNILAHQNQLKGVWINLIMNAVGAIEGQKGVITVLSRYEKHEFRVAISDNGKGIAPEHQEHIFEPFFTTKDASKGTKFIILLPDAPLVED